MRINACPEPIRLLLITSAAVFTGEALVMLHLQFLPPLPVAVEALVDALTLTALVTPVLYFFLYRPMRRHIRERAAIEEDLRAAKAGLEVRVAERTGELSAAVESLRAEVKERRRTEEDLSRTNLFIRSVVESAPFLILIYEHHTLRPVFANGRLMECLGYLPEDACLQGPDFFERVLDPGARESFHRWNEEPALEEGIGDEVRHLVFVDAGGRRKGCNVTLTVLSRTEEGAPKDILLVAVERREGPAGEAWEDPEVA